ncbi:MAG: hypothetical protein ACREMF_00610, partial [Gemmatimonadales bacterium]
MAIPVAVARKLALRLPDGKVSLALMTDAKATIAFQLNGESCEVAFAPHKTLLEVLREDLGLTGT